MNSCELDVGFHVIFVQTSFDPNDYPAILVEQIGNINDNVAIYEEGDELVLHEVVSALGVITITATVTGVLDKGCTMPIYQLKVRNPQWQLEISGLCDSTIRIKRVQAMVGSFKEKLDGTNGTKLILIVSGALDMITHDPREYVVYTSTAGAYKPFSAHVKHSDAIDILPSENLACVELVIDDPDIRDRVCRLAEFNDEFVMVPSE